MAVIIFSMCWRRVFSRRRLFFIHIINIILSVKNFCSFCFFVFFNFLFCFVVGACPPACSDLWLPRATSIDRTHQCLYDALSVSLPSASLSATNLQVKLNANVGIHYPLSHKFLLNHAIKNRFCTILQK